MSNYELISVALQISTVIVVAATLAVYYKQLRVMSGQLRAMQDSTQAQNSLSLVEFLQSPEVREARRGVRGVLSNKDYAQWTDEEKRHASIVVANYDVVAALLRSGFASADLIASNWAASINHCHKVLKPYIEEQRELPDGRRDYWQNYDWLNDIASSRTVAERTRHDESRKS